MWQFYCPRDPYDSPAATPQLFHLCPIILERLWEFLMHLQNTKVSSPELLTRPHHCLTFQCKASAEVILEGVA